VTVQPPRRVLVVADTRELRSGVVDRLREEPRLDVRVRPHKVGDYWIDGLVAIERKSCRDFYASIFDGRLFQQLIRMRQAASRCLLIVEGLQRSRAFLETRPWLNGVLVSVAAGLQVPWIPSRDTAHTAELLRTLALQELGATSGDLRHAKGYRRSQSVNRWLRLRVLQAVPLVGPKRATSLLQAFGSLGDIFTADEQALAGTRHVGDRVAKIIAELGRGEKP